MKKLICVVLSVSLMLSCFVACSGAKGETASIENAEVGGKNISVVATIFPEYDWAKQITGNVTGVDVTMLLDNGVDLHSYQPTTADIVKVSECDLFIYVGGESDEWVEDVLEEAVNPDMEVINLLDVLGDAVKEEQVVEGMEAEEEEEAEGEEEEVEYDEHVWLSLKNAKILCSEIEKRLAKIDSDNASEYEANLNSYVNELEALDKKYEEAVSEAKNHTVLFGDRFPFRYMVDDYGLDYYAAFVGCSAESEASFETILFLAGKMDELGLSTVLQIETADGSIAKTICENTKDKNQNILTMDSMQATTSEDVKAGATYLGSMENNLEVLEAALN